MLEAIFKNLLGFDIIIMLLAVANGGVFYMAYTAARKLYKDLSSDGLWQADVRKDKKKTGACFTHGPVFAHVGDVGGVVKPCPT